MSKYFCPLFLDNGLYPGQVQIHLFLTASLHLTHPLHNVEVKPYVGQFGEEMDFHTDDYRIVI
ncbi:hypothetical protein EH264_19480 [Salmonella enterica]|uniref:Uncharacterized protein n=14 Tax=Salmonella enterica TaxID=28901 RepID=A0A3Z5Z8B0_SALEB|nr:hypothetical protein [Salmonella enterica]ACF88892.1 hypothetical protein SeSA_A0355 [Salmonella enterica subsp. enterica serovar Schwarzengrund str. CVM19633]APV94302.1 hypothetical protein SEEM9284_017680 [Salmonella enterica subsp. enterica serovar Minnesota str. ATCC 49284]APW67331.1 hypothetical protein LFZ4_01685 [Salmonella enterica subsp. enterica serovar Antsalova str. S01-0511]AUM32646.1 hypothetical protein LM70_19005 [Salmonella enterica subsp. enterica serovar Give]EAA0473120.1